LIHINACVEQRHTVVGGRKPMNQLYRICFFKKLVDSTGHPVDACQDDLKILASAQERAIDDARVMFAKRREIPHWSLHADYETVELLPEGIWLSAAATAMTPVDRATGNAGAHRHSRRGNAACVDSFRETSRPPDSSRSRGQGQRMTIWGRHASAA
jgi:hypothetical protein